MEQISLAGPRATPPNLLRPPPPPTPLPPTPEQVAVAMARDQRWLDLIQRVYGYAVSVLTTTDAQGQATGYLPLCAATSPLTGRRLVALPFTDLCPLLAADSASARGLIEQALDLARAQRARYLELRCGANAELAQRDDFAASDLYVRSAIPLMRDEEAQFAALRQSVRQQVRKARKLGVHVRFATARTDMEAYHRLHLRTRSRKHGMPAQPLRFFLELWDTFAPTDDLWLLLADYQGAPIAGMVLLRAGTSVRFAYGASDERALHLAPNHILFWETLRWAIGQGFESLDLGRTARDNGGLLRFKRGWGAVEEPLLYYYSPRVAGLAATAEHSWKYRVLTACWKHLPLAVSAPLGAMVYKHLG